MTPPLEKNFFTGKTVLIVSPQPWERMRVSKHHYAIEAAKHASHVYFLNPPDNKAEGVSIEALPDFENISLVAYRPFFPVLLRFKARPLFDFLMRFQAGRIVKNLPPLDVLWCFDTNYFSDLRCFQARTAIYHPVDPVVHRFQTRTTRTADLLLAVSREILESARAEDVPAHFIQHGLSECFLEFEPRPAPSANARPRFGFVGTLVMREINHELMNLIIRKHPEIDFVFWGKSALSDIPPHARSYIAPHLEFLESAPNVELRGVQPPRVVAEEIQEMDGFFLFLLFNAENYDKSNSHKILEYLSTGKVIVSCYVGAYRDQPDLVRMPQTDDDSQIEGIFDETVERLDYFNGVEFAQKRRAYAEDNTYPKQLARISNILSALPGGTPKPAAVSLSHSP